MLMESRYEDGSAMQHDDLFDELGTFLFAGHETSALAMAWATYHLLSNPIELEKLKSSLDSASDQSPDELSRLPLLKAVVSETLRLNPIITEVVRVVRTPMNFGSYRLPVGTAVAPAAALVHYDPEIYPEPEAFHPDRFIDNQPAAAEYIPFGGGARRCAGAAFASYEMTIVLGTIFKNFDLTLLEKNQVIPKRRNLTMGPSSGIRVTARPRAFT